MHKFHNVCLIHFSPVYISIPPENFRKPLVFWRFQGVKKCDTGLKWVNAELNNVSGLLLTSLNTKIIKATKGRYFKTPQ